MWTETWTPVKPTSYLVLPLDALKQFLVHPWPEDLQKFHARNAKRKERGAHGLHQIGFPLLGTLLMEAGLIDVLGQQDSDVRVQRSLEPEWLVVEALFSSSHAQYDETNTLESKAFTMLVGGIAKTINQRMSERVEEVRLTAKKTGLVLRALGIRTKCLGKYGRGIEFHAAMREKVHELSKQFGITRRDLLSLVGDEPEYGGAPCELCEKYGVTGGLKFVPLPERKPVIPKSHRRMSFEEKSDTMSTKAN